MAGIAFCVVVTMVLVPLGAQRVPFRSPVADLARDLADSDLAVRRGAVAALVVAGPQAVPYLVARLTDEEPFEPRRWGSWHGYGDSMGCGPDFGIVWPETLLPNGDWLRPTSRVRFETLHDTDRAGCPAELAAFALGTIGEPARPALTAITTAWPRTRDDDVRDEILRAVERIGGRDDGTLAFLCDLLADERHGRAAAKAMAAGGTAAVAHLTAALHAAKPRTRGEALFALSSLQGADHRHVARTAARALGDPADAVWRAAVHCMCTIDAPAVPALLAALADARLEVRQRAAGVLALLASGPGTAVPALLGLLYDADERVACWSAS